MKIRSNWNFGRLIGLRVRERLRGDVLSKLTFLETEGIMCGCNYELSSNWDYFVILFIGFSKIYIIKIYSDHITCNYFILDKTSGADYMSNFLFTCTLGTIFNRHHYKHCLIPFNSSMYIQNRILFIQQYLLHMGCFVVFFFFFFSLTSP